VLNRGWKRDSLQMMIFVYVCSTWCIVVIRTRFETWITRNDVNGVSLFHLSSLITFMDYVCSQRTANAQINYFIFDWSKYTLFVLNGWKRYSLQIMIFVYVYSAWSIVELKTRFETWMSSKHLRISSLGKNNVSRPYLAQRVWWSTNQT
jgi:hypothetical protein